MSDRIIDDLIDEYTSSNDVGKKNEVYISLVEEFKKACLNFKLPKDVRTQALKKFIYHIPDEGNEMLGRYRDFLMCVKGKELNVIVEILLDVGTSLDIELNPFERLITAISLYNIGELGVYNIFEIVALDDNSSVLYKSESCKFLMSSGIPHFIDVSQETLIYLTSSETTSLTSAEKYALIATYITKSGVSCVMNKKKLNVPMNEDFIWALQHEFFFNAANGIRERILSGQSLLQLHVVPDDEKHDVEKALLDVSQNVVYEENIRADAADVVLRLGTTAEIRLEARRCIKQLGLSHVNRTGQNILQRVETVYNNSQNVHEIDDAGILAFVKKMVNDVTTKTTSFDTVKSDIGDIIRSTIDNPERRFSMFEGLNRISIDTATFTEERVTSAEVLVYVFTRIMNEKNADMKSTLTSLLLQELESMGGTCSSGHISRLILALQPVDDSIKISYDKQLIANIAGRVTSKIRQESDDVRGQIAMGMLDDADVEDYKVFTEFINRVEADLRVELESEFVLLGYMTQKEFDVAFEAGMKSWKR